MSTMNEDMNDFSDHVFVEGNHRASKPELREEIRRLKRELVSKEKALKSLENELVLKIQRLIF